MIFENKQNGLTIETFKETDRHVYLKSELSNGLSIIKAVYENEVTNISYNQLCKMAVNYLIETVENLPENEAIELLKTQHKETILL